MTECNSQVDLFSIGRRTVTARFDGEEITSDAGVLPLSMIERKLRLAERLAAVLDEEREPSRVQHTNEDQLRQRLLQICCGYEDCNDATTLRHDAAFQIAFRRLPGEGSELASQPTLSRFEQRSAEEIERLSDVLLDFWVERTLARGPGAWKQIILDFDSTDDPTHGEQQGTMFHGYYDQYMYHPLVVFDGEGFPIAVLLRPGNAHGGQQTVDVLLRLFEKIAERFPPEAKFLFRADAGFALPDVYEMCEALEIEYVIGMITHQALKSNGEKTMALAREQYRHEYAQAADEREKTLLKTKVFGEFTYQAGSWNQPRRVVMKAEISREGENPRFIVTNLTADPEAAYSTYTGRGQSENYIKDLKNAMFADRLSCHRYDANHFRLLLHTAAYILMFVLREQVASIQPKSQLATAQMDTLRLKLIKIGAALRVTARNVWVRLSASHPFLDLWHLLALRLASASPG